MSLGTQPLGTNTLGADAAIDNDLLSMFNFCNPFDTVLPEPSSNLTTSTVQAFLWGFFDGITPASAGTVLTADLAVTLGALTLSAGATLSKWISQADGSATWTETSASSSIWTEQITSTPDWTEQ